MNTLGIYIHVPFCGRKCDYCDFYSLAYRKDSAEAFTDAVLRNIRHYADTSRTVNTVYFGGGTPSLLTAGQLDGILSEIGNCFSLDGNAEITLEANPNTITPEKLRDLRRIGINRLSLGVQSMIDDELRFLGRTHSAERAEKAVLDAHQAGFGNISCDLMIAVPKQTSASLAVSIERIAALPIQHVSAYILKVEEGTPFDKRSVADILPDDDTAADLYLQMTEQLEKHGFMQYEVSNFAAGGFESRHNCRYWNCLEYIGIGPSAHSCFGGKRFAVERDLDAFIRSDVQQTIITDDSPCGFEERAMLALRLKSGLDLSTAGDLRPSIEKKIPCLVKAGYAEICGERLSLTPKGFLMSNSIITSLIFDGKV